MNPDPEIEVVRTHPKGLSGKHSGPNVDAGQAKAPIGDPGSPSDVFDHVLNPSHLSDKHNNPGGHGSNRRPSCSGDRDTPMTGASLARRRPKPVDHFSAHRRDRSNWLGYGKNHSNKIRNHNEIHISNVCPVGTRWKNSAHASGSEPRTQLQHSLCMNL
jgi:hypothetical protein